MAQAAGGAEAAKARLAEKTKPGGSRVQNRWRRESAAEWQGMLIAYEISSWFERLQADGLLSSLIEWPSRDAAAAALREYKAKGDSQHDLSTTARPKDPAGYLHDARLALEQGLTDHVFLAVAAADLKTKPSGSGDAADAPAKTLELGGSKLKRLRSWIELQSETFPQRAVRLRLAALHAALGGRGKWSEAKYDALLTKHGFATQPAEASEWRWCAARGNEAAGVGGYTCGLWLLFHATLANSDRVSAAPALRAIAAWVHDFFGCAECVLHFGQFYSAHDGAHTSGHIDSAVWLWRAHNAVNLRLRETDADAAPFKKLWPAVEACKECYKEEERNGTLTLTLTPTPALTLIPTPTLTPAPTLTPNQARNGTRPMSDVKDYSEQWDDHRVFEFLQETFCFESDTFVCAGFDDSSREVEARTAHRASLAQADAAQADAAQTAAAAAAASEAVVAAAAASEAAAAAASGGATSHEEL